MARSAVVSSRPASMPWETPKNIQEMEVQPKVGAAREVEWYQPTLKALPASTVDVFTRYVGLESEEEIKAQIYAVRDKAWNVLPYPCIGLFRFLDFSIHLSPAYPSVLTRLRAGETLLDLGCCFGQDLRKVALDSGTSANLLGADIEGAFMDLGYELFRDSGKFQGKFFPGSIFDGDFLEEWYGKIDMIYLGSFLHLFNTVQQRIIVKKLSKLLVAKPGVLVFGRNLGAEQGGEYRMESLSWDLYRHSNETIRELWEGEGEAEWKIESSLSRYESAGWDDSRRGWQGNETKQMMFTAERL